ncbi:hypothetical protein H2204_006810 [Knufia peltigerae]|uniref:Xylanolytic transcriptional activator regulatory domain-containing protein n=1 Tax=Knufia peltigerae TaxID=1002370 RepID=A0AA38Y316_9EURO|nr:hypothetical protein H2204_006810 [Knufia peltigerae]
MFQTADLSELDLMLLLNSCKELMVTAVGASGFLNSASHAVVPSLIMPSVWGSFELIILRIQSLEKWRAWVDAEGLRRLGWAVYKYDASVAYLHNNRPFLSTGDVNLPLPASVEHWGAESGQAWAALHPWSQVCPSSPRLRPTIRSFFDNTQRPLENIVVEEHIFLITLTLVRMLWTLKEIRSSPINDLVSPPVYDNGRQTLLQALDGMMVSVVPFSKLHTKAEIDRVVHRMQLIHVAHLYGAGDLMNWLWPSLRDGPEAENARERMRQWSNEDMQRSRNVVYHCAQLLGLIRHYPNNMPFEVFLIFHAGVVLSCIVPLLEAEMFRERTTVLHLDQLDSGDELLFKRHDDWVKNGGNTQLCLTGVPSLCSAGARRAILDQTALLLRRQKVWGMARNLTKVVLSLGARSAEMQAPEEQLI